MLEYGLDFAGIYGIVINEMAIALMVVMCLVYAKGSIIFMKKYVFIALCVLLCVAAGCGTQSDSPSSTPRQSSSPSSQPEQSSQPSTQPEPAPSDPPWVREPQVQRSLEELTANTIKATLTMEDGSVIEMELYPDLAPQSVRNFVHLARDGFYDGLTFHRIISGFMLQGGCPNGNGGGNPGYAIWGEYAKNGFTNELKHTAGVLSMARQGDPAFNSAGSQFFIMHGTARSLDEGYAAFGKVTSGIEVVNRLAGTPVTDNNGTVAPANQPRIRSITIDDDIELPEPEKLPR